MKILTCAGRHLKSCTQFVNSSHGAVPPQMPAHRAPKRFLWPPIRSDLLRRRDNPRHRPPRRCRSLWVARQSGAPCGLRERREGLAACLRQRVLAFGLLAFCASPVLGPFFSAPSSIPPRRRCACPFAFSLTHDNTEAYLPLAVGEPMGFTPGGSARQLTLPHFLPHAQIALDTTNIRYHL